MGLDITVGMLASVSQSDPEAFTTYSRQFAAINDILLTQQLPPYQEPSAPQGKIPWGCEMWSYSGLHYLRRIAAYLWADQALPPPGTAEDMRDPMQDGFVDRAYCCIYALDHPFAAAHLLWHSDSEGYYLPFAFDEVVTLPAGSVIRGGMLGSAAMLLTECQRLAEALAIPPDLDPEATEVWEAADQQGQPNAVSWKRYGIETFTCTRLLRACEVALESKSALVFHEVVRAAFGG